jgi:AAA+ ATPase superfamily predicted ATPase
MARAASGFFNRADELEALDERWASPRGELVVVFGRRRVGKSRLIAHWADRRPHLYYEASAGGERDQLEDLGREIARVSGRRAHAEPPTSWRAAFAALEELVEDGPLLIAFDEFQFIARHSPEVGSLVNGLFERHARNPNLFLILAGSDVSFFEREVVGYAAVSYGRRTGALRVEPFAFPQIAPFLPRWRVEDRIRAFAVYGGMPYYLDALDPAADLGQNILRTILYPDGLLRHEPEFLLAQESRIRERETYISALRAIAAGHTRLGEIAQRIQRRPNDARSFLQTLEDMRLIRRERPVTAGARGPQVRYAITDPFLRFWFTFIAPYQSRLQSRAGARAHLAETVLPTLDEFVSRDAFEEVCQRWALAHIPGAVEVGRWWGSRRVRTPEGLRTRRYEADVVALDASRRVLALGSCKWSRRLHDAAELDKLETIAQLLEVEDRPALYFFDRTGFSKRLRELAHERADVRLVRTAEISR